MCMILYDFTRLNTVYFIRSKDEASKYLSQYLADYRFIDVPFPVLTMLEKLRVEHVLAFAGNGVSDKGSLLQIAHNLIT